MKLQVHFKNIYPCVCVYADFYTYSPVSWYYKSKYWEILAAPPSTVFEMEKSKHNCKAAGYCD